MSVYTVIIAMNFEYCLMKQHIFSTECVMCFQKYINHLTVEKLQVSIENDSLILFNF